MIIDGQLDLAEYINVEAEEETLKKNIEWKSILILELQYFWQIAKFMDTCIYI